MIVTEEEAKTRWCPEANAHGDSMLRGVMNDGGRDWQHTLCIGSACMAWRWHDAVYAEGARQVRDPARGYCGKAGRP